MSGGQREGTAQCRPVCLRRDGRAGFPGTTCCAGLASTGGRAGGRSAFQGLIGWKGSGSRMGTEGAACDPQGRGQDVHAVGESQGTPACVPTGDQGIFLFRRETPITFHLNPDTKLSDVSFVCFKQQKSVASFPVREAALCTSEEGTYLNASRVPTTVTAPHVA